MNTTGTHGYIVLADISGFVPFLSAVELEHATEILAELLALIVDQLQPLLTVSSLQGDAVLAYTPATTVTRGETVLELIEATYAAFQRRLAAICRHTTCNCQACASVNQLDLKFLSHYGHYLLHTFAGSHELMGLDVQLVRGRVLKQAPGLANINSHALFTEPALHHLGLEPAGMSFQESEFEEVGRLGLYSLDLQPRYQALMDAQRIFLNGEEADAAASYDFAEPPAVVWEWVNDPVKRSRWFAFGRMTTVWTALARPEGRTGRGAQNHCNHGLGTAVETILDWRPFDYYTAEEKTGFIKILLTYHFEPLDTERKTRLRFHMKLNAPFPRWVARPLSRFFTTRLEKMWGRMAEMMAQEQAAESSDIEEKSES